MIIELGILGVMAWKALAFGSVVKVTSVVQRYDNRPRRRTVQTKDGSVSIDVTDFVNEEGNLLIHHAIVDGVVMTAAELGAASAARKYKVAKAIGVSRKHLEKIIDEMVGAGESIRSDTEKMKSRQLRAA